MQKNAHARTINQSGKHLLWASVIVGIGLLDGFFKWLALLNAKREGEAAVAWPVDILLHKNSGVAFNVPIPLPIVLAFTFVVLITLAVLLLKRHRTYPRQSLALLAIFVGALGNFLDRLVHGFTTDYLILLSRSAINLSDILILIGSFLVLVYTKNNSHG